ncbi:hypothetical protein JX265_002267 [Neoarthrinium moseri]|uniref:Pheromone receptor n=1 Tax=Neoarthrinium moseri TaxID=1658444 RepID=A0A9Q0AU51_9PEZI|nr:hypothetical protein JX266_004227 [Neoarthrinium moseri]KAI1879313.1 hypothetical protein JX265_002267 [Neoarthrinium moseri]
MNPINPKTQNFTLIGSNGTTFHISLVKIDGQRMRLANICISYGVQLGLSLMMLLTLLLLVPVSKMRKAIHVVHITSLIVAVIRLVLLIQYFPGPLSEYYVAWTQDVKALGVEDYGTNTAGNAFNVVQFALIETALVMQSWGLIQTWPDLWQYVVKATSVALAVATVTVKSVWVVRHTWALRDSTLPVPLDAVGEAATVLGAVSIFYFCGIFFMNLSVHLATTRSILVRTERGLTSLEILAIGNGLLMVLPSIFAGLDIATGLNGARVLPFDAGSWVMTLVVIGLPLTGLIARYRGPSSHSPSNRVSHRFSLFAHAPILDSKIHTSQTANTTLQSPTGTSFVVSAEATRPDSSRSGREGSRPKSSRSNPTSDGDLESGIQVRKDVSVTVEGTPGSSALSEPEDKR